jgi:predicted thioesterase
MKTPPNIGAAFEQTFVVEQPHLIDFAGDSLPAVLCTPALVGFLENTARRALMPFLDPTEQTVGTEIELRHLAPTPLGETVTCRARVIGVEGSRITLQVEARDEHELIARGLHTRHVILVERFARVVQRKTAPQD